MGTLKVKCGGKTFFSDEDFCMNFLRQTHTPISEEHIQRLEREVAPYLKNIKWDYEYEQETNLEK